MFDYRKIIGAATILAAASLMIPTSALGTVTESGSDEANACATSVVVISLDGKQSEIAAGRSAAQAAEAEQPGRSAPPFDAADSGRSQFASESAGTVDANAPTDSDSESGQAAESSAESAPNDADGVRVADGLAASEDAAATASGAARAASGAAATASDVGAPEPAPEATGSARAAAPDAVVGTQEISTDAAGSPADGAKPLAKVSVQSPALSSTNPNPVVVNGKTVPPAPRSGFRVLPYLQQPSADGMTINFFSETGTPAIVTVTGPGLPDGGTTFTVEGISNPVSGYQDAELSQGDRTQPGTVEGSTPLVAEQGSWIRASEAFKYSQRIAGLEPDTRYDYTVTVDGYEHKAHFTTFPEIGAPLLEPIHFIAFSDTETDQVGRVTYREWVKGPLTEDSEARPDPYDSDWVRKFGNNFRDGEMQLRYMLTEDQAQKYNNELIRLADPDLLIIAGDIVERGSWQTHWDEWFRYFAGDENVILDTIPVSTSLGNHEVYGYCNSADDCTPVVRARAQYNWNFDTHGSANPEHRDAYHRLDYGPVTVISLDSTNGTDQMPDDSLPDAMQISGDDSTLTPDQYGTDTQNAFTIEQYERDFPKAVEAGWWGEDADPSKPDQPNFMPGTPQYEWFEEQLKDARERGQMIIVQWHHVAYSNGVHGTTMGHEHVDAQPGTPMRHMQPLLEKYQVAAVISGHDETFQVSYVDEDGDGIGVYHWDVGVASDGLRGERMIPDPDNPDGPYIPLGFNTHSVWMAQRDVPETWAVNDAGVKHLVNGGKNYGYLDMVFERYTGEPLQSGEVPHAVLRMLPVAMFPILNDAYDVVRVEARPLDNGLQLVYFDSQGNILDPKKLPVPDVIELPDDGDGGAQVGDGEPQIVPGGAVLAMSRTKSRRQCRRPTSGLAMSLSVKLDRRSLMRRRQTHPSVLAPRANSPTRAVPRRVWSKRELSWRWARCCW